MDTGFCYTGCGEVCKVVCGGVEGTKERHSKGKAGQRQNQKARAKTRRTRRRAKKNKEYLEKSKSCAVRAFGGGEVKAVESGGRWGEGKIF